MCNFFFFGFVYEKLCMQELDIYSSSELVVTSNKIDMPVSRMSR